MNIKIKTFNTTFWVLLFLTVTASCLFYFYYAQVGLDTSIKTLFSLHVFATIYYFIYKIGLTTDKEYSYLLTTNGYPDESLLKELFPLNLCNTSFIVAPLALLTLNHYLIAFMILVVPFSISLALLMPSFALSDDNLFKPRVFGFYFTHLYPLFLSITMMQIHLYSPQFIDSFAVIVIIMMISLFAHLVNTILIKTKLCVEANYFFTYYHEENSVLKALYNKIHIPWIYLIPLFICAYFIVTAILFILMLFV